MICPICKKRKAKRHCPAKGTQICSRCCGAEREVTIDCPFDCRYLQEARQHDYAGGIDPKNFSYKEIRIDEAFLRDHSELVDTCGRELLAEALAISAVTDFDVSSALDALVQTYKTLESGIYYNTQPDSVFARRIVGQVQQAVQTFREEETRQMGFAHTKDSDLLRIWVFFYRMALDRDNGRPKGKAFLDFLRQHFGQVLPTSQSSLIIPGA